MQVLERHLELENGSRVKFTSGPRHPFWKISFESGSVPRQLSGLYTDHAKAVKAVERYVATRPKNKTKAKVAGTKED